MSAEARQEVLFEFEQSYKPAPAKSATMQTISRVHRGDIWQLGQHRLLCGDTTNMKDVQRLMQGEKADLVFADPPYGIGIDEWDKTIEDLPAFFDLVTSNLKQGGFFAFTHQMPYMVEWLSVLQHSALRYKDHIAWIKRMGNTAALPLIRTHESLFIYTYGKANYYQTKGRYEDVKLPGVLVDIITLEGIDRYIKDLRIKASGRTPSHVISDQQYDSYRYMAKGRNKDCSPEFANFTNVWSFLPENKRTYNKGNIEHPTVKSTLLLQRLIELCSNESALVYDAFLGSGTTLIAAENTGRRCYGIEISEHYCNIILSRWEQHTGQQAQRMEVSA